MDSIKIRNAVLVDDHRREEADVLIRHGRIAKISRQINELTDQTIDARGQLLMPGVIDDQVHFREPGLTHKATIATESRAAIAGGITSFMEMPNTVPLALTQELLADKYRIAAATSHANYSFFMGTSNENLDEVLQTDPRTVCGVKIFMGSSTGNMLVDRKDILDEVFRNVPMLIAVHCEKEEIVRANMERFRAKYGDRITPEMHPLIRSHEACFVSSSEAIEIARKHNSRLHILHISTAQETQLFDAVPNTEEGLKRKRITAEACVHHLTFTDQDYRLKGNLIKWNPAVKTGADREAIWEALQMGRIDVIATDHAPHTLAEKGKPYLEAPSGGPLVQHSLPLMLTAVQQGRMSMELLVWKMCNAPSLLFEIEDRGFIREDYHADLVLVDPARHWTVTRENVLYKCSWSPLEGHTLTGAVTHTFLNGQLKYREGRFNEELRGQRLLFNR